MPNDRMMLRRQVVSAWLKHRRDEPLEPLERQIVDLLLDHPEYHDRLERDPDSPAADYPVDDAGNPFLHLALHLALREQVGTDRPAGIAALTRSLLLKHGDGHRVEHRMMEVLADSLYEAQQAGTMPDERRYLERLRAL